LALLALMVAAAAITLGPLPFTMLSELVTVVQNIGDWPRPHTQRVVERLSNVVLFIPIGLLLGRAAPACRRLSLWASCTLGSCAIEVAQCLIPGRTVSATDVVMNSSGAAIGLLIHRAVTRPGGLRGAWCHRRHD
jgi:glycopeptide antibiotics resistance protein